MSDDLVTIATYRYLTEAEAVKMHLESEGIRVFLSDAEIVAMDWLIANAVGGIKVQVPKSELEIASVILKRMQRKIRDQAEQDGDGESMRCLACGAEIAEDDSECPACGWSYDTSNDQ